MTQHKTPTTNVRRTDPNPQPRRRTGRAARNQSLRTRVVALTVALFIAAWVVIGVQMASGHDPSLSKRSTVAATSTTSTTGTATTSTATTGTATTSTATPVTTSQS